MMLNFFRLPANQVVFRRSLFLSKLWPLFVKVLKDRGRGFSAPNKRCWTFVRSGEIKTVWTKHHETRPKNFVTLCSRSLKCATWTFLFRQLLPKMSQRFAGCQKNTTKKIKKKVIKIQFWSRQTFQLQKYRIKINGKDEYLLSIWVETFFNSALTKII